MTLALHRVRPWGGPLVDISLERGNIAAITPHVRQSGRNGLDGNGAILLPGLHDHHLHVLALAARRSSVDLAGLTEPGAVTAALARGSRALPPGAWLRAVNLDERVGGIPDAATLDRWVPERPAKVQDRTGALWVLNSSALRSLGETDLPPGCERDVDGRPTGRFWREDSWLGERLPRVQLDVAGMGNELAAMGVVGLTDASAHNSESQADFLAAAGLPQRLTVMGGNALVAGPGYCLGPLKLLIDERDPPDVKALAARIAVARENGRAVAAHCVTATELALYLAALEAAGGARAGDRIEHGGEIGWQAIAAIARTPLTVVTNPGFIASRGDRYRASVPREDWEDLYRAASLTAARIPLAGGSDAPYGPVDPWIGIRSARDRQTALGEPLGAAERLNAREALSLYLGASHAPGKLREIVPGAPADLMLCEGSLVDILADLTPKRVVATIVGGNVVYHR